LHVFITQVEDNVVRVVRNTFVWNACAQWILCSFISYVSCFYPISEHYYPSKTLL